MFYIRGFLILVWVIVATLICMAACLVRWGDFSLNRFTGRTLAWGILRAAGVKLEVLGEENLTQYQPCIFVINHQSGFDIGVLGQIIPKKTLIIGKKELIWIPFFGFLFVSAGNLRIDRKDRTKAIAGLDQILEVIQKEKASIWIFPEGTRNHGSNDLLPFKRGAFYMAIAAQIPIVPIVTSSYQPLISLARKHSRPGTVQVKVLPAVQTTGYTQAQTQELSDLVRAQMLEAVRGLTTVAT